MSHLLGLQILMATVTKTRIMYSPYATTFPEQILVNRFNLFSLKSLDD